MTAALCLLRWTPQTFWRATPRELAAALGAFALSHPPAPDRAALAALMERFPDGA